MGCSCYLCSCVYIIFVLGVLVQLHHLVLEKFPVGAIGSNCRAKVCNRCMKSRKSLIAELSWIEFPSGQLAIYEVYQVNVMFSGFYGRINWIWLNYCSAYWILPQSIWNDFLWSILGFNGFSHCLSFATVWWYDWIFIECNPININSVIIVSFASAADRHAKSRWHDPSIRFCYSRLISSLISVF